MRLKKLRIQNFRSFLDSTVEFPERGMVLIRGRDRTSGESSGTGKTAIFLAIAYALDCLPSGFTAKALQNWFSNEDLQVTLTLEVDGKEVVLSRGTKTQVDYGDRQVKGAKSYPEELARLVKVPLAFMGALTFRPQDTKGLFPSMGPTEKLEFLSELLGLGQIEVAVDKAEVTARGLATKHAELQASAAASKQSLELLESTKPMAPEGNQKELIATRDAAASALNTFDIMLAQLKLRVQEATKDQTDAIYRRVKELDNEILQSRKFEANLLELDRSRQVEHQAAVAKAFAKEVELMKALVVAKNQLKDAESTIRQLKENKCPTCKQAWADAQEELQRQLAIVAEKSGDLPALEEELRVHLEGKLPAFLPDPKIAACREITRKLTDEKFKVGSTQVATPPDMLERLVALTRSVEETSAIKLKADWEIQVLEKAHLNYEAQLAKHNRTLHSLRTGHESYLVDLQTIQTKLNAERDFIALMGKQGFLGRIVEEVLTEISDEATKWLGRMANVNRVNIVFTTENEKGRQQIQTWVDVRGNRAKPEAVLSGGQLTSVAQAVDLAVMSVITRRRGGVVPGWLCLDEVFNGQGQVTKDASLEILKEISADRLVMVIDHGTETKESFSRTIDIEFNEGISEVVQ